jgi:hypothetical protein
MNKKSESRATQFPMRNIVEYFEDQPAHLVEIALDLRRIVPAAAHKLRRTL